MEYLITFPPWYLDDVPVNASAGNGVFTLFIGGEAKQSLNSNPEVQAAKWLMWKSENPKTSWVNIWMKNRFLTVWLTTQVALSLFLHSFDPTYSSRMFRSSAQERALYRQQEGQQVHKLGWSPEQQCRNPSKRIGLGFLGKLLQGLPNSTLVSWETNMDLLALLPLLCSWDGK